MWILPRDWSRSHLARPLGFQLIRRQETCRATTPRPRFVMTILGLQEQFHRLCEDMDPKITGIWRATRYWDGDILRSTDRVQRMGRLVIARPAHVPRPELDSDIWGVVTFTGTFSDSDQEHCLSSLSLLAKGCSKSTAKQPYYIWAGGSLLFGTGCDVDFVTCLRADVQKNATIVQRGIYKLTDDGLLLSVADSGNDHRPLEFKPSSGFALSEYVLESSLG